MRVSDDVKHAHDTVATAHAAAAGFDNRTRQLCHPTGINAMTWSSSDSRRAGPL